MLIEANFLEAQIKLQSIKERDDAFGSTSRSNNYYKHKNNNNNTPATVVTQKR